MANFAKESSVSSDGLGASFIYTSMHQLVRSILSEEASLLQEDVDRCLQLIEDCAVQVDKEGLFSANEQLDDIPTNSLKVR